MCLCVCLGCMFARDWWERASFGNAHSLPDATSMPSSDGMGRTGAFVCIDCELERLKSEGLVDIFQFVKSARCFRPFLVENVVGDSLLL